MLLWRIQEFPSVMGVCECGGGGGGGGRKILTSFTYCFKFREGRSPRNEYKCLSPFSH